MLDVFGLAQANDRVDIVTLGGLLLNECRKNAEGLRRDLEDAGLMSAFGDAKASFEQFFKKVRRDTLLADELRGLAAELQRARTPLTSAMMVRAAAESLDSVLGDRFASYFLGQSFDVKSGEPFPVHFVAPDLVGRGRLNGNPATRTAQYDQLKGLRIAPVDMRGIRVHMTWGEAAVVTKVHTKNQRFAVGVTNQAFKSEFDMDRYTTPDGIPAFYRVRPISPDAQWSSLSTILDLAVKHDVGLLVLPELCLDEALLARTRGHLDTMKHERPLVIAGSRHVGVPRQGDAGTNESVSFFGRAEVSHAKFRPYVHRDKVRDDGSPADTEVPRREHLAARSPQITIFGSPLGSLAVLICKDALDTDVQHILQAFAVQTVAIPSMSDQTDDMEQLAANLASDPQATTVIANIGPTRSVVGRPLKVGAVQTGHGDAPSIVIFSTYGNTESKTAGV